MPPEFSLPFPPSTPTPTFRHRLLTTTWILNLAILFATVAWIFVDPLAERAVASYLGNAPVTQPNVSVPLTERVIARIVAFVATASLCATIVGLYLGPPAHRRLRSWLALTALVAAWLAFCVAWPELAWNGRRWRLARHVPHFNKLAETLRADWPRTDGAIPGLGQFNAYPIGRPRMLLMIADDAPPGRPPVVTVERTPDGVLRFELGGNESGAWVESRPSNVDATSFVGGLLTQHGLLRSAPLTGPWHLAVYGPQ